MADRLGRGVQGQAGHRDRGGVRRGAGHRLGHAGADPLGLENSTSPLSAKCRKYVRAVTPARCAISATVVCS